MDEIVYQPEFSNTEEDGRIDRDCPYFKMVTWLGQMCTHPDADLKKQRRRTALCAEEYCPLLEKAEANPSGCRIE